METFERMIIKAEKVRKEDEKRRCRRKEMDVETEVENRGQKSRKRKT